MKYLATWSQFPTNPNSKTNRESGNKYYTPRWGHTLNIVNNHAYVFGGYNQDYLRDMYMIDLHSNNLRQKEIRNWYSQNLERSHHSGVVYKENIIYYGGYTKQGNVEDYIYDPIIYSTNTNKMRVLQTDDPVKEIRGYHTANLVNRDTMFVFGGEDMKDKERTWNPLLLNLKTWKWSIVSTKNIGKFSRKFHCSCTVNDIIVYIYGGYIEQYSCVNSILVVDFTGYSSDNEKRVETTRSMITLNIRKIEFDNSFSNYPFPRWGCSLVYSTKIHKLIMFGGRNWYDFNDTWWFDITNEHWEELIPQGKAPINRRRHVSFIYHNILFISGGFNGIFLNDIHYLNLNSIEQLFLKSDNISKYIKSQHLSDMTLRISGNVNIPCHRGLFLRHITDTDCLTSEHLVPLLSSPSKQISINLEQITNDDRITESIIPFITLLYLGYIPLNIKCGTWINIISIMKYLKLKDTLNLFTRKFIITKNIGADITSESIENLNLQILLQQVYNKEEYVNWTMFNNSNLILRPNKIHFGSGLYLLTCPSIFLKLVTEHQMKLPLNVKKIIKTYVNKHNLEVFFLSKFTVNNNKVDDLLLLIEGWYYADFFCFTSLYQNIELLIISLLCARLVISHELLVMLLICGFCTNSRILFRFLIGKLIVEYKIRKETICSYIKWNGVLNKGDSDEMIKDIRFYCFENEKFLNINKAKSKVMLTFKKMKNDFQLNQDEIGEFDNNKNEIKCEWKSIKFSEKEKIVSLIQRWKNNENCICFKLPIWSFLYK